MSRYSATISIQPTILSSSVPSKGIVASTKRAPYRCYAADHELRFCSGVLSTRYRYDKSVLIPRTSVLSPIYYVCGLSTDPRILFQLRDVRAVVFFSSSFFPPIRRNKFDGLVYIWEFRSLCATKILGKYWEGGRG